MVKKTIFSETSPVCLCVLNQLISGRQSDRDWTVDKLTSSNFPAANSYGDMLYLTINSAQCHIIIVIFNNS